MKSIRQLTLFLSLCLLASVAATAQTHVVDVNQLTAELQKDSPHKDDVTMVWWIPNDYWRAVLEQEKLPKAQIEEFAGTLRPYTIVAVFDGKIDDAGKTTYRSESDIRSSMRLIDTQGVEYAALPQDKVGPSAKSMLNAVRPIVTNMLGQLGANFHFLVFPGLNAKNEFVVDPRREGQFRIRLERGREFVWRLPLSSLLPPKRCPVDGERLNGSWRYCPWHGAELKN